MGLIISVNFLGQESGGFKRLRPIDLYRAFNGEQQFMIGAVLVLDLLCRFRCGTYEQERHRESQNRGNSCPRKSR